MKALGVGDPLERPPGSGWSSMRTNWSRTRRRSRSARTRAPGASAGERARKGTEGVFLAPALFGGATNDRRISREEIFRPVAGVIRVKDDDGALAVANGAEFGLSAGLRTTLPR